ncbi:MAG TPA: LysM peptidoglycan-binding domain-containing protein [Chthoniobacterales bacterium]|nr:LysM peptidoglycan-binding domain-containing protein [Chthoniobacterales bacterium]
MPKLFKFKRKKLRATAVRRPIRVGAATADYGELAEPSMKLSRALLVVLLLHVVAVAGIIAFNAIKTRQGAVPSASTSTAAGNAPAETKPQTTLSNPPVAQKATSRPQPKIADSGKTYVVAKGDNPVTIAKKFKVSYDDLLALNHIDDARKLKIGQRLLIPERSKTAKKNE